MEKTSTNRPVNLPAFYQRTQAAGRVQLFPVHSAAQNYRFLTNLRSLLIGSLHGGAKDGHLNHTPLMKTPPSSLLILTLAGCFAATHPCAAVPSSSSASTTQDHTTSGSFQTSAGIKGTHEETFTVADSVATDTVVYTSADGTEASTVTTTTKTNTDGTSTVVFSDLDFGATVTFISTTTYSAPVDGSAIGTGTFTAVDGTTGTLTSITTRTGQANVNSINFTSTAGALTRQVRLEERGGPADTLKVADVDVLGTLTSTAMSRFEGMHRPHQPGMGH